MENEEANIIITYDVTLTNDIQSNVPDQLSIEEITPLAKYGDFSTRHVNCMSVSNPFGDVMLGDMTVYGNLNIISDMEVTGEKFNLSCENLNINDTKISIANTNVIVDSSNVILSSLSVNGLTSLQDVIINGDLIVNRKNDSMHSTINMNKFLTFGEEGVEGSWRIGIINGNMTIQKLESNVWVNKSTIQ